MPLRPEITLCRECLRERGAADLESFAGRVVAFEPDPELFTQYFFVAQPDFEAVGLRPEVAQAIAQRLSASRAACARSADSPAKWLWFSREQVASLDEVEQLARRRENGTARSTARGICWRRLRASAMRIFST